MVDIETKRVQIALYPYYDGRRMWPVGDILTVPKTFGMKKVTDEEGKPVVDEKTNQIKMVPSDNFVELTDDNAPAPRHPDKIPIYSGSRIDPNLMGLDPEVGLGLDPNLRGVNPGTPTDNARVQIMPSPAEQVAQALLESRAAHGQGTAEDARAHPPTAAAKAAVSPKKRDDD